VPLDPEQITTAGLARDPVGGYKARPVAELLKRVAWDYRKLLEENKSLGEAADGFRRRIQELEPQIERLEHELARRRDPGDVSRAMLAAAQRIAGELRASARADGEAALKKAHARARSIEAEARRRVEAAAEAERLGEHVRARLQAALDTILAGAPEQTTDGTPPAGEPGLRVARR
jgi:cell division septum initiation protein DivIVA